MRADKRQVMCECGTCKACRNRAKGQRYRARQAAKAELEPPKPHKGRARSCNCGSCTKCKARERQACLRARDNARLDADCLGYSDEEIFGKRYTISSTLGGQTYSFGRR